MYLQFYINDNGDKVYTTKKESPLGLATQSAHPVLLKPRRILGLGFWGYTKKNEASNQMEEAGLGLKVSDAELVLYLHPSKSKNVSHAIFDELSSMLFKFNETFDGVLLAYSAFTKDESAKILPGLNPYFGVKLQAQLLLFYPKPGMLLEGKVVKLGEHSIHIIVLGFSSATIIDEDIPEEFSYKVKHGKEVFASTLNRHHKIEIGTIIRFMVKSFDEEILQISGSLLPPNTGSVSCLDKPAEETKSNIKKRKEHNMENDNVSLYSDSLSLKSDKQIKKSKKHSSGNPSFFP